jgi:GT2 family glycosyltransferase
MTRPTLGVVVTNYDSWDLTRECLAAVLSYADHIDSILLVDDASPSQPPPLDGRVRLMVNSHNLGLVRSLNRALELIKTDLVVVFDCDAVPLTDFTAPVRRAFAAESRLALVGFATVDGERRPTASFESEPDVASLVLGQRLHRVYLRRRRDSGSAPLCVYACAMALRRSAFAELGGFDERFDWLDFDHDFSMRVHRSPWQLRILPEVVVRHSGSGAPQRSSQRVRRFYRNRWLLLAKHGKIRWPILVRGVIVARLAVEALALRTLAALPGRHRTSMREKARGRELALGELMRQHRTTRLAGAARR